MLTSLTITANLWQFAKVLSANYSFVASKNIYEAQTHRSTLKFILPNTNQLVIH